MIRKWFHKFFHTLHTYDAWIVQRKDGFVWRFRVCLVCGYAQVQDIVIPEVK
jgi:hypothetical protein